MDFNAAEEEDNNFQLIRSNSWSHAERQIIFNRNHFTQQPYHPKVLDSICEMEDTESKTESKPNSYRNRSNSVGGQNVLPVGIKKKRHSYTELIASAILSSPEHRKTLAEIYDWFVTNIPSFRDQRYMHSSLGWKNAVRHNLSVQTCFKRVKRHGMEKPSWWTVDMAEVSKRRLVLRPTMPHTNSISSNANMDVSTSPCVPSGRTMYNSPNMDKNDIVSNEANFKIETSNGVLSTAPNCNLKRIRHTPIRPAVTCDQSDTIGMQTNFAVPCCDQTAKPMSRAPIGNTQGFTINDPSSDNGLLKPYPIKPASSQTNPTDLIPSVALVCKEPTSISVPYPQAQLELTLFESTDHSQRSMPPITLASKLYTSLCSTMTTDQQNKNGQIGLLLSSGYQVYPTNVTSTSSTARPIGTFVPNQTLRVKTVMGSVQDVNFTGLLPMRTVVKRDGGTQTEEAQPIDSSIMNKAAVDILQWNFESGSSECSKNVIQGSGITSDLPEDLAGLQIEGDLYCDIDTVLTGGFDPPINKPVKSTWDPSPVYGQSSAQDYID